MKPKMRALVLRENQKSGPEIESVAIPALRENEVLVRIQAAALNHRDLWIQMGRYANITYPAILGSDGCGRVEEVKNSTDAHWLGKSVIINPAIGWGDDPGAQSSGFQILGMPAWGTFAEYLVINSDRLMATPEHLSDVQAAALPLAGLTAFRAVVTQSQVQANQRVLVTGIGGGVALYALQFAFARGAKVFVTSGNDTKITRAQALGAVAGVNYNQADWVASLHALAGGGFDVIIDGAGGTAFNNLLDLVGPGGCIVNFGATQGEVERLNLRKLFWKQIRIQGSTMGTDAEFASMLEFVHRIKLQPVIDSVRPIKEFHAALEEMKAARQFGKLVLQVQDFD